MDDLIAAIIALLAGDAVIQQAFTGAGAAEVGIAASSDQSIIDYPFIFVTGRDGEILPDGDSTAKFLNPEVSLEIYTKRSNNCTEPDLVKWQIANRCFDLLFGNRHDLKPYLLNRIVGSWRVTSAKQVNPTGEVPDPDPLVKRHRRTIKLSLSRI